MLEHVFLSSTFTDLAEHREMLGTAIRQLGMQAILMEDFGARDERPVDECLRLIREESKIFVGIYAHRYGHVPDNASLSIVEMEYHAAAQAGVPRLIYLVDPKHPWLPEHIDSGTPRELLECFKATLLKRHICLNFSAPADLAMKVVADLGRQAAIRAVTQVTPDMQVPDIGLDSLRAPDGHTPTDWSNRRNAIYNDHRRIFLTHTAKPSATPGQVCDIYIYLIRHGKEELSDVAVAEFFFGRHWKNKIFPAVEQHGIIGVATSAFGTFLCLCRVTFKDGTQIYLERYIDFETSRVG